MTAGEQSLDRLRAKHWKLNKRTVCLNKEFKSIKARHELGAFKETLGELQVNWDSGEDAGYRNLNVVAVTLFGLGEHERALKTLDKAEAKLTAQAGGNAREHAMICVNRANVLKAIDNYEGAHVATHEALRLDPNWVVPHLMAIALHASDCDLDAAWIAFEAMDRDCPDWDRDPDAWWYLLDDFDYAPLRLDPRFERWLNRRPQAEGEQ